MSASVGARQRQRVLITGGAGFIGYRLGVQLTRRSHDVVLVDRAGAGGPGVVLGDVLRPDAWQHLLDGIDVIVHAAGIHQIAQVEADPGLAAAVNVEGTRRVLDAAVRNGVRRFIFFSTSKVYGEGPPTGSREDDPLAPADAYARTKVLAERICHQAQAQGRVEVVVVRPFSVYGPSQDTNTGYVGALLKAVTADVPATLPGEPHYTRDFVHVDAVVDLSVALVETEHLPSRVLNAGRGQPTRLDELVSIFREVTGYDRPVTYRRPHAGTLTRTLADVTLVRSQYDLADPGLRRGLGEMVPAAVGQ